MNLLGAIIVWMATVFAVASRDTLSGSLVGLSVTYAMDVSRMRLQSLLSWAYEINILKPDYRFYSVIKCTFFPSDPKN